MLLAPRDDRGPEFSVAISGNIHMEITYPFEGKSKTIGAIVMIRYTGTPDIGLLIPLWKS
jgi:hypothetical protein